MTDGLLVQVVSIPTLLASVPDGRLFTLNVAIEGYDSRLSQGDSPWIDGFPTVEIELQGWMLSGRAMILSFIMKFGGLSRELLVVGRNLASLGSGFVP